MYRQTIELNKHNSLTRTEEAERSRRSARAHRKHNGNGSDAEIEPAAPENGRNLEDPGDLEYLRYREETCKPARTESAGSDQRRELAIVARAHQRRLKAQKKRWWLLRLIFWIGPAEKDYSGSNLIHPGSPFAQVVAFTTTLMLLYVAIVTPVAIGFFWEADPCDRSVLQEFDMALDCWFILEIILNFFVGAYSPQGMYIDEMGYVAKRYVKHDFAFDLVTSIPVAIIEHLSQLACHGGGEATVPAAQLRIVRATKPLRIFKMLRVLKTSKLLIVLDYLEAALRPPPFMTRMLRMLFSIFMIVHICACCFWLIKDLSASDSEVEEFLESNSLPPDSSLMDKYLLSAYFVNTVFTTVGFGDIKATTQPERVFVVIIMYVGTLVFGTMLGEVQNAMAQLRKGVRERSAVAQEVKDYLRDNHIPRDLETKLMAWVNFNEDCKQKQLTRHAVWDRFPAILKRQLATHLQDTGSGESLMGMVAVIGELEHRERFNFLLDLYMCMESETFGRGLPIAVKGHKADKLHFVRTGQVLVTSTENASPIISTLIATDHFGEYALFEDTVWEESYWSKSFVECWTLSREAFQDVLSRYDEDLELELAELAETAREEREATAWIKDRPRLARWRTVLVKVMRKVHQQRVARGAELFQRFSKMASFKMAAGVRKRISSGAERRTSFTLPPSSRASSQASQSSPETHSLYSPSGGMPAAPLSAETILESAVAEAQQQQQPTGPPTTASERQTATAPVSSGAGTMRDLLHLHQSPALSAHAKHRDSAGSVGSGLATPQPTLLGPQTDMSRLLKKVLEGQLRLESQVSGLSQTLEVVRSDLHRTHLEVSDLIKKERRDSVVKSRRRKSLSQTGPTPSFGRERSGSNHSDGSSSGHRQEREGSDHYEGSHPLASYGSFVARGPAKLRPVSPATKTGYGMWEGDEQHKSVGRRMSAPVVDASLVFDGSPDAPPNVIVSRRTSSERRA